MVRKMELQNFTDKGKEKFEELIKNNEEQEEKNKQENVQKFNEELRKNAIYIANKRIGKKDNDLEITANDVKRAKIKYINKNNNNSKKIIKLICSIVTGVIELVAGFCIDSVLQGKFNVIVGIIMLLLFVICIAVNTLIGESKYGR